jgi:glycosyltransferase involved in cell wall biosynthesis
MHVLYLHQYYCPTGGWGNDRSRAFSRYWVSQGVKVTVVTSVANFPPNHPARSVAEYTFVEDGVVVHVFNVRYAQQMPRWRRLWAFWQFFRRLTSDVKRLPRPDIIYASSTPPTVGEAGRRLAKFWKVPFVFETVDVWPDVPIGMGMVWPFVGSFLHDYTDRIYRDAAMVVALSDGMSELIHARDVPMKKIEVVYNGTDTKHFGSVMRLNRKTLTIVYAGTVGLANDAGALLRAAALVRTMEDVPDFRLLFVGGGSHWQALMEDAKRLGLLDITQFVSAVPKEELPAYMDGADIGVVTFAPYKVLETNSANKFYDYLASGLPVVINYEGWQADYLSREMCGLSSEGREPLQFALNLYRLLTQEDLRLAMGRNARRLAEAKFNRDDLAEGLLAKLQTLVS